MRIDDHLAIGMNLKQADALLAALAIADASGLLKNAEVRRLSGVKKTLNAAVADVHKRIRHARQWPVGSGHGPGPCPSGPKGAKGEAGIP